MVSFVAASTSSQVILLFFRSADSFYCVLNASLWLCLTFNVNVDRWINTFHYYFFQQCAVLRLHFVRFPIYWRKLLSPFWKKKNSLLPDYVFWLAMAKILLDENFWNKVYHVEESYNIKIQLSLQCVYVVNSIKLYLRVLK